MFKAPTHAKLPHLHTILDNIGLSDNQVAHFLGVCPNSVKRWRKLGQAPRAVMLALFWETSWGRSAADCEADQFAKLQFMRAKMLERKVAELEATVSKLQAQLDKETSGAANSPWFCDSTQIGSAV